MWGVNSRPRPWCKGSPQASAHGQRVVKGALSFFTSLTRLFHREEGWNMPCYPWWASSSTLGELLTGKSRWRPKPRSLGVS
jgi:hypothetical protein